MATIKHISSKNAYYGATEQYLTFEHDKFFTTLSGAVSGMSEALVVEENRRYIRLQFSQ